MPTKKAADKNKAAKNIAVKKTATKRKQKPPKTSSEGEKHGKQAWEREESIPCAANE